MNTPLRRPVFRFCRRFVVAMLATGLAHGILSAVAAANLAGAGGGTKAWAMALLPVLPLVYGLGEAMRYGRSLDELQMRVQTEALATAAVVGGMGAMVFSWLHEAGAPVLPPPAMLGLFGLAYFAGVWRAARKYQ